MKMIGNDDITDLKKKVINNPSSFIKFSLELLALSLNTSTDWKNCIKVLNKPELLKKLKKFDIIEIKPSTISKIKKKITEGKFTGKTISKECFGS